jgi:hypothetical protein
MAEPAPATGVASRRWWDLTSKELNIVAVTLLFLITLPLLTKIFTSDYGTHLALGREIVRTWSIAGTEFLNYPSLGRTNPNGSWLFEAVLYLVWAAGGNYGVSFFLWVLVSAILFLIHRSTTLRGADPLVAALALFAFSGFLRIRIQPRPEMFTYLFVALTIYLNTEYYYGTRRKLLWLFPPMMLAWANSHPSYLIGFILVGAYFVNQVAREAWNKELSLARLKSWGFPPVAVGVLGLIVFGFNPHGYDVLLVPLNALSRGGQSGAGGVLMSISELTPTRHTGFFVYYKAAAVFASVSLILGLLARRVYLIDLFLFAITFKGAWDSARAVSMMGLFLSPGISLHLSGFIVWVEGKLPQSRPPGKGRDERSRETGKGKGKGKSKERERVAEAQPERRPRRSGRIAVAAAMGVFLVIMGVFTLSFSMSQLEYGLGMTEHKFSFAAAEFLRKNPVPGKMFNFFDIGGFLDWQLYPGALTFIDGRTYNQEVFMEHQVVTGAMPGWEKVIDKYGITYFVLKAMDSSGMILPIVPVLANHPGWSLVFSDGLFVVFVRNTPDLQQYIRAYEIPKGILPQHIIREAYHYMFLGVSPIVAYQTMSNMYMLLGDRMGAVDALRKGFEETDEPFFRERLRQLEESPGRNPFDQNRKR